MENVKSYVVLDIETTGLMYEFFDEVIEVCAIRVENNKKIDEFHSYIHPSKKISKKITEITSITDEMVEDAPSQRTVLKDLRAFIKDSVVVAYNAAFDVKFLNYWFYRYKMPFIETYCCAMEMYKANTGVKTKLELACSACGISLVNAHSALYDTRATADLFIVMLENNYQKEIHHLSKEEIYAAHKKRTLNASYNKKAIESLLLNQPVAKNINHLSTKVRESVYDCFHKRMKFDKIAEDLKIGEDEVHALFVEWANWINIVKYNLFADESKKEATELLKLVDYDIEKALVLNKEITTHKSDKKRNAYPELLFCILKKFNNCTDSMVYTQKDLSFYFNSRYDLDEIAQRMHQPLEKVIPLFVDWVLLDNDNREIYRSYLNEHLVSKSCLAKILEMNDTQRFVYLESLKEVEKFNCILTLKLYYKGFFLFKKTSS